MTTTVRLHSMKQLPADVWHEIFTYVGVYQLGRMQRVCRLWHEILTSTERIWQTFGDEYVRDDDSQEIVLRPKKFSYKAVKALLNRNGNRFRTLSVRFRTSDAAYYAGCQYMLYTLNSWKTEELIIEENRWSVKTPGIKEDWTKQDPGLIEELQKLPFFYPSDEMDFVACSFAHNLIRFVTSYDTITCLTLRLERSAALEYDEDWYWCQRPSFKKLDLLFRGAHTFLLSAARRELLKECQSLTYRQYDLYENEVWFILDQAKDFLEYVDTTVRWSSYTPAQDIKVPEMIRLPRLQTCKFSGASEHGRTDAEVRAHEDIGNEGYDVCPWLDFPLLTRVDVCLHTPQDVLTCLLTHEIHTLSLSIGPPFWTDDSTQEQHRGALEMISKNMMHLAKLEKLILKSATSDDGEVAIPTKSLEKIVARLAIRKDIPVTTIDLSKVDFNIEPSTLLGLVQRRIEIGKKIECVRLCSIVPASGVQTQQTDAEDMYEALADLVPQVFVDGIKAQEYLARTRGNQGSKDVRLGDSLRVSEMVDNLIEG